ncbi:MAG: hypothetical protein QOE61_4378, partial [Micromonosporaceae bacterium]|nr:hypothetical protein [Micromonosporaceae bacterium]
LGRVHHRGGIGPPVVGAEQAVERFRGAGKQVGVNPGGEVGVECGEGLPRALGAGDLQRAVETGEAQPFRRGPAVVVRAHPAHKLAVGRKRAPPVAEAALRDLAPVPQERGDTFVGPLSRRLGIRPATLRKWERAGLVQPRRDPQTGYRVYSAADVRDALLVHQLRRGGYLLEQIAPLIAQVHSAGGVAPLESMLRDWHARLSAKSRAMLTGAAVLDAYLGCRPAPPGDEPSDYAIASSTADPIRPPATPADRRSTDPYR